MAELSAFTFADLIAEVDAFIRKARSEGAKVAWHRLREEIVHVSGLPTAGGFDPTTSKGLWWLTRVEVSGFRGISSAGLILNLDPTPGITVIHGLNGAGKSSICDAIDVGLHQKIDGSKRLEGTGGRQPVWEPVLVNSGGVTGLVTLSLAHDDGRRLKVTTEVGDDSASPVASELLNPDNSVQQVHLAQEWKSAVDAYTPTYAYASWEQHIHRASDLQRYLEGMLVLGGCFGAVERTIERKAEEAHQAQSRVSAAEAEANEKLISLSNAWGRQVPFPMPSLGDDVDEWWHRSGMPLATVASDLQTAELSVERLLASADRANSASRGWAGSGEGAQLAAAAALSSLSEVAGELDSETCPVCGSKTAWQDSLHSSVEQHQAALERVDAWRAALAALITEASILPALLRAAAPEARTELARAVAEYRRLEESRVLLGTVSLDTAAIAKRLLGQITSEEFRAEADAAIARCSAEAGWLAALAAAMTPLADVLRRDGQLARESTSWKEVTSRLGELRKRLRHQRQGALKSATNQAVATLLEDAGLSVSEMSVLSTKAAMTLEDATGRTVELGMLSAGQRNAVLLAPALAIAEGGPFGFMIVDDPVHSFDDMRVDFVARQLSRIAMRRRVVVLTHDERLKEHLLAASAAYDSRSISRDARTGRITLASQNAMWEVLLDDAYRLKNLANSPRLKLGLTNTLRGLCRQAFDNALRLFVTREATRSGSNVGQWLADLDAPGVDKTADRIDVAEGLVKASPAEQRVTECRSHLDHTTLLRDWNRAAHGNDPDTEFTDVEIRHTRDACKVLLK